MKHIKTGAAAVSGSQTSGCGDALERHMCHTSTFYFFRAGILLSGLLCSCMALSTRQQVERMNQVVCNTLQQGLGELLQPGCCNAAVGSV